jgi:ADP-ribosyl-[dinitrogen reductase] hydrolase
MTPGRVRGSLLGLAIGDAVGATNEFQIDPPPIGDMLGGGTFRLEPGQWTDDTSMALCLADSLLACKGHDPADQMERYVRWWREGYNSVRGYCFDIGNTTVESLQRFMQHGDPYAGDPSPRKAGNGSLMRLAPVVLFYRDDEQRAMQFAADSSRTTHAAPQAVESCSLYALLIVRALKGLGKAEVLHPVLTDPSSPVAAIARGEYLWKQRSELKPSGYVIDSLECALWCFAQSNSFREGCLMAANLGGDADTIAAIYGQLAGAFHGEEGIPVEWIERLAWSAHIQALGSRLHEESPRL